MQAVWDSITLPPAECRSGTRLCREIGRWILQKRRPLLIWGSSWVGDSLVLATKHLHQVLTDNNQNSYAAGLAKAQYLNERPYY